MARAAAMRLGSVGAFVAIDAALLAACLFFLTLGYSHDTAYTHDLGDTRSALLAPAVLLALGIGALAGLALLPGYPAALAFVQASAAAAGFANLALVDVPSAWAVPALLLYATPPALLVVAAACAVAEAAAVAARRTARPALRSKT
jgi:hypothetical protein